MNLHEKTCLLRDAANRLVLNAINRCETGPEQDPDPVDQKHCVRDADTGWWYRDWWELNAALNALPVDALARITRLEEAREVLHELVTRFDIVRLRGYVGSQLFDKAHAVLKATEARVDKECG